MLETLSVSQRTLEREPRDVLHIVADAAGQSVHQQNYCSRSHCGHHQRETPLCAQHVLQNQRKVEVEGRCQLQLYYHQLPLILCHLFFLSHLH